MNTVTTILFIVELFRTGLWKRNPQFDYISVLDLFQAMSVGGTAIRRKLVKCLGQYLHYTCESCSTEGSAGSDVLVAANSHHNEE